MSSPFQILLTAKAILTLMKKPQPPATHGRTVHRGVKYTKGGTAFSIALEILDIAGCVEVGL